MLASLQHPGIVRVFSSGEHRGSPYLVLELVEGGRTLVDAFANARPETRAMLVLEVAQAVAHAHAAQVVHRDLKPANVLVDPEGRPKVCDFGLASARDVERLTRTGSVMGTPQYMSPEQITGKGHRVGPPADVWALAVLLYEALTGTLPFNGRSMVELAGQITRAKPAPLHTPRRADPPGVPGGRRQGVCPRSGGALPHRGGAAVDLERVGLAAWSGVGRAARSRSARSAWVAGGVAAAALVAATMWGLSGSLAPPPAPSADPRAGSDARELNTLRSSPVAKRSSR